MRAWWKFSEDERARRAWGGVGVPVLALVLVIVALAVATLAGFARQQDRAFVENTQRLVASGAEAQADALAPLVVDFANWDASFANITTRWNQSWVDANIYSSVVDAMFILRADGTVRYNWFAEGAETQRAEIQREAIDALVRVPNLRRLARADTPGQTATHTYALHDGRWLIVSVAPVTREDNAARMAPRNEGYDYIAAVKVIDAAGIANIGAGLGLVELTLLKSMANAPSNDDVRYALRAADGRAVGMLQWRHTHPGATAFQRQIGPVVLMLLCIGALTIMIARQLVARQIEAVARAAAAAEDSRQKSEFLARVTNDLRTPLTAVIGYAELIQEETLSPTASADAQRIIDAARVLSTMLGDIIDQSRLDLGSVQLKPEVVPVAGILAEVQGLLHPVARAANVELAVSQEAHAAYAFADHARLRQCLLNIVGNAVRFSPRHSVVRARAGLARTAAGDMIVFDIRDEGIGIAANDMGAIFRPFTQANPAISAIYGGAGLGLSIARGLAREMGGDVTVASTPGEGAAFTLRIPAATARALNAA